MKYLLLILGIAVSLSYSNTSNTDTKKLQDSLKTIIENANNKLDSINLQSIKKGKNYFNQTQRDMPLLLPKKVKRVMPSGDLQVEIDNYSIWFRSSESFKIVYADVTLSPSNRWDITVFPMPILEYAFINKVKTNGRITYLDGLNVTIGIGVYGHSLPWEVSARHRYFSRLKLPFKENAWLEGYLGVQFDDLRYHFFRCNIKTALQFSKYFSGALGLAYENKEVSNYWHTSNNKIQGVIGIYLNINRYIRFEGTVAAGVGIELLSFIGDGKIAIGFLW